MTALLRWLLLMPFAAAVAMLAAVFATFFLAMIVPEFGEVVGVAVAAWVRALMTMLLHGHGGEREVAAILVRASALAAALLLAPVIITAVASELFRWRSWAIQAAVAATLSVVFPLGVLAPRRMLSGAETRVLVALALVGVVAGSIYWLIAGRGAGGERPLSASAPSGS